MKEAFVEERERETLFKRGDKVLFLAPADWKIRQAIKNHAWGRLRSIVGKACTRAFIHNAVHKKSILYINPFCA